MSNRTRFGVLLVILGTLCILVAPTASSRAVAKADTILFMMWYGVALTLLGIAIPSLEWYFALRAQRSRNSTDPMN